MDSTISPLNLDKNHGKFVLQTFNLGLPLCQQKSYRTLVDSTGVQWSPVDSYRNKGGGQSPPGRVHAGGRAENIISQIDDKDKI